MIALTVLWPLESTVLCAPSLQNMSSLGILAFPPHSATFWNMTPAETNAVTHNLHNYSFTHYMQPHLSFKNPFQQNQDYLNHKILRNKCEVSQIWISFITKNLWAFLHPNAAPGHSLAATPSWVRSDAPSPPAWQNEQGWAGHVMPAISTPCIPHWCLQALAEAPGSAPWSSAKKTNKPAQEEDAALAAQSMGQPQCLAGLQAGRGETASG